MKRAAVAVMIEHWTRERPDLDVSSLAVLARISRLARVAAQNAEAVLSQFGLSEVEFLLLAAIRMAPDQHPSPRDLLDSLMVTSGGLTNRLDRLENAGLIERAAHPTDRRGIRIELTAEGRDLVDRVTTAYVDHQNHVLDGALQPEERESLARLLRKLLDSLTDDGGDDVTGAAAEPATRGSRGRKPGRPRRRRAPSSPDGRREGAPEPSGAPASGRRDSYVH